MNRKENATKTLDSKGCLHDGIFPVVTITFGLMFLYISFIYVSNKFNSINLAIEGISFWKFPVFALVLGFIFLYVGKPWRYKVAFLFSCLNAFFFSLILFPNGHGVPRGDSARVSSCMNNMKQLGLVCEEYANNSNQGFYPTMMSYEVNDFNPKVGDTALLTDQWVLHCPANSHQTLEEVEAIKYPNFTELNYWYLSYAVTSDEEMKNFMDLYKEYMETKKPLKGDIPVERGKGFQDNDSFVHLSKDYRDMLDSSAKSKIPVFIEKPENHPFPFINILFLDGHVEFMPYPGEWPATEFMINTLREMEELWLNSHEPIAAPS